MNQPETKLDSLKRIVTETGRFREDPQNLREGAYSALLDDYLKKHLSSEDWSLWRQLQFDWEESK